MCWKSSRLEFLGSRRHPPHYLPKGQTIIAKYYSSLLVQVKDILKENCRGKVHQWVLALAWQCPGSPGTCNPKETGLGFQCLDHPPCSLDLAPSDYHLFPGLKKQLNGRHLSTDVEVIAAAETWLDGQPTEFFLSGLQKLEWLRCVLNFVGSMLNKFRVLSL